VTDPYREEEAAQFRTFLAPLRQLLEICAESVGRAMDTDDVDQARVIVGRVLSTLEELLRQTKAQTRPFLERLDPPEPPDRGGGAE